MHRCISLKMEMELQFLFIKKTKERADPAVDIPNQADSFMIIYCGVINKRIMPFDIRCAWRVVNAAIF